MTDKKTITALFMKTLEVKLKASDESIAMQKDYLADQPGPMQSRYDSGLVEGQWQLSEMKKNHDDMSRALAMIREKADTHCDCVENGALVILQQNNAHNGYLFLDAKGAAGASVFHDGRKYTVITPQSPLGKVLAGKKAGDIAELKTSKVMRCKIEEVC